MVDPNTARYSVWLLLEVAGILRKRKRKLLMDALEEKQLKNNLEPLERKIWAANKLHPENYKSYRKFLETELLAWENRAQI